MTRLRVQAGPNLETLTTISANTPDAHSIKTSRFEGKIAVCIKDYVDEHGEMVKTDYFDHPDRQGVTWSIQVEGEYSLDRPPSPCEP